MFKPEPKTVLLWIFGDSFSPLDGRWGEEISLGDSFIIFIFMKSAWEMENMKKKFPLQTYIDKII